MFVAYILGFSEKAVEFIELLGRLVVRLAFPTYLQRPCPSLAFQMLNLVLDSNKCGMRNFWSRWVLWFREQTSRYREAYL